MMLTEATPMEQNSRTRRNPSPPPGMVFAMASPPVERMDVLWPSWLSPVGASWRRPTAFRSNHAPRNE
jgi:hypothetical protein